MDCTSPRQRTSLPSGAHHCVSVRHLSEGHIGGAMPFFKLNEMPGAVVAPGHSTAHGPTITGEELELGYYTEPKGTGAKPHHHKSEQIILVLSGRLRMRVGIEVREIGPGEAALIP